mmetsp:Transcript_10764/g.32656  ORF Transcript_10764/g.32656 Transcript_10764/m.32656 type:complete len:237 (+) Transcript_10764:1649-2359(+)
MASSLRPCPSRPSSSPMSSYSWSRSRKYSCRGFTVMLSMSLGMRSCRYVVGLSGLPMGRRNFLLVSMARTSQASPSSLMAHMRAIQIRLDWYTGSMPRQRMCSATTHGSHIQNSSFSSGGSTSSMSGLPHWNLRLTVTSSCRFPRSLRSRFSFSSSLSSVSLAISSSSRFTSSMRARASSSRGCSRVDVRRGQVKKLRLCDGYSRIAAVSWRCSSCSTAALDFPRFSCSFFGATRR